MVGSVFFYFGLECETFYSVFEQFGTCEPPARLKNELRLFREDMR